MYTTPHFLVIRCLKRCRRFSKTSDRVTWYIYSMRPIPHFLHSVQDSGFKIQGSGFSLLEHCHKFFNVGHRYAYRYWQRDRHIERQTYTYIYWQRDRETQRDIHLQRNRDRHVLTGRRRHGHRHRCTNNVRHRCTYHVFTTLFTTRCCTNNVRHRCTNNVSALVHLLCTISTESTFEPKT